MAEMHRDNGLHRPASHKVLEVLNVPDTEVVVNLWQLQQPRHVQAVLLFHQCLQRCGDL